ncbi:MAG: hypothetical protein IPP79_20655 [Chitinophagaceae bacterium]|nr:hypothetical protein [Chitinophagaceae bacterium]
MSKIDSTDNYIDWLNKSPIRNIHDAIRGGSPPSDSLLFLLLSNSLLNYYWDASMRIYEGKMGASKMETLTDFHYSSLMDAAFPFWNWKGKTMSVIDEYINNIPTTTVISQNKKTFASIVFNYLKENYIFLDYLEDGKALSRKAYRQFILGFHPAIILGMKYGTTFNTDFNELINNNYTIIKDGEELDAESYEPIKVFNYPYKDTLLQQNETPLPVSPLISANSRYPFLFFNLEQNDIPGTLDPMDDNSMANYLKRPTTITTYPDETILIAKLHRYLPILSKLPTAELERLMAEHLDLCSHRLDAWLLSVVNQSLWHIREKEQSKGLYIGAYGYIENLKPNSMDIVFQAIGDHPVTNPISDPSNQGYIHAPSLAHAQPLRQCYGRDFMLQEIMIYFKLICLQIG